MLIINVPEKFPPHNTRNNLFKKHYLVIRNHVCVRHTPQQSYFRGIGFLGYKKINRITTTFMSFNAIKRNWVFKQIISSVVKWKFSGTFIINMGLLLLLCSLMQLKEISVFVNICTIAAFSEIYGESKVKT